VSPRSGPSVRTTFMLFEMSMMKMTLWLLTWP